MRWNILLFSLLVTTPFLAKAQLSEGKITGRIIDSISAKPLDYATISLITKDSGKVVNGATTNEQGVFMITNVAEGTYQARVAFIGYQTKEIDNIIVNKSNANIQLGDISLILTEINLKEVTVTGQKSVIENKIDKMVYNVDQDVTSQTGVATDVLRKVPQVSIDIDGNVELQGNSSIRFLINGKPSVIFGNNIADVLQSIPASRISKIEIITSPGARYDASGTGGIINIILKKSNAEGLNGNISLSGGTRLENASVNLSAHHKHFGVHAYFGGNAHLTSTTLNSSNRTSQDADLMQSLALIQDGSSRYKRNGYETGIGFDWDISEKDNISGALSYDYFSNNNAGFYDRNSILKDFSENIISNVNDQVITQSNFNEKSVDWELNYLRKFNKEDQELEISYSSSMGHNYSHYRQTQQYLHPNSVYSGSYADNPGTEDETNISIDYTQPVKEDVELEMGARAMLYPITATTNVYALDPVPNDYTLNATQSSSLHYRANVYAGYFSGAFSLFDWLDVKMGLRYEYTDPKAYFSNAGDVSIKPYATYVPNGVIAHTFKHHEMLKLTFSRRIERPEYRDLNPYINASDPKNLSTGNTGLRPEIGNKVELAFDKTYEQGTVLSATLFYRGNKDDIQSYTRYYSTYAVGDSIYNNVAVTTRENVGREDNYGLNLFVSVPASSRLNLRSNISAYQRYILNGALAGKNIQGFNYRANINAAYTVSNTFILEFFGNFNSRRTNTQGSFPAFVTYSFALRKQLFHKTASFALTATNPFNEYIEQKTTLTGDNFTLYNVRQLPYRSFGINFTYKFGKVDFNKEPLEDRNLTNPPVGN